MAYNPSSMFKCNKLIAIYFLTVFFPITSFAIDEDRYKGLNQQTLYYLRESYQELAEYFEAKGDKTRANEMRERASNIPLDKETLDNPPPTATNLTTADLPESKGFGNKNNSTLQTMPLQARNPFSTQSIKDIVKEAKEPDPNDVEATINYLVNRYLFGLITKNLDVATEFFADSVEFPGYQTPLSKQELRDLYSELLATYQLDSLTTEDFYSLDIAPQLRQIDENHVEYILFAQDRPPTALENSGFWNNFFGNVHVYVFTKSAGKWSLTGLRTLPLT